MKWVNGTPRNFAVTKSNPLTKYLFRISDKDRKTSKNVVLMSVIAILNSIVIAPTWKILMGISQNENMTTADH